MQISRIAFELDYDLLETDFRISDWKIVTKTKNVTIMKYHIDAMHTSP